MVRKRSPDSASESPRIDDLKLINGIGPAVEKRLNGVGIFTFARLAALSPADIAAAVADLTGLSSERIFKQDWIGQSRKLAAGSAASEAQKDVEAPVDTQQIGTSTAPVEPPASIEHAHAATLSVESEKDAEPSMERYHPATFTLEFLLDEDSNVHSTHVLHAQSKREHTWTGLQKIQLLDFLSESAGLNIPSDESAFLNAEEPVNIEEPDHAPVVVEEPIITEEPDHAPAVVTESEPLTPLVAKPTLTGTLRVRKMEMIGVESSAPRRTLTHDEPFAVRLTLDLTELQVPGNTPLNYKASIYGKEKVSRSGLVVGEAQGTIIPAPTVSIKVEGNTLPEGTYHLAANVILGLPGMKLTTRPDTTATIDGGRVQVL